VLVEVCQVMPHYSRLFGESITDGGPRSGIGGCCGGPTKARCRFADGPRARGLGVMRVVWSGTQDMHAG
jgi:hypothetical protein